MSPDGPGAPPRGEAGLGSPSATPPARPARAAHVKRNLTLFAGVVALVALAAGCGSRGEGRALDAGGSAPVAPFTAEIAAVAAGPDGHSLVAHVAALPVDGSTGDCAVTIAGRVTTEEDRAYVDVLVTDPAPDRDPTYPDCDTAPRDVAIDVGRPVAGMRVIAQNPSRVWVPTADGTYSECALPSCDPSTGVAPAPATCDDATLADAVRSGDVPRHAKIGIDRCELPWAVVDVDIGAGACPATEGPNPCAGKNVHRTYWEVDGSTWRMLAESTGAGCGDVADQVPDFPLRLCAGLPSLP